MNWKAANEQQEDALWRVFLMFVAMAVLVIRTGLVARGVVAIVPREEEMQHAPPTIRAYPSSTSPADLHQATLVLLCLAEAAGRLVITMTRAVWELMNQPLPLPAQERPFNAAGLCEHLSPRLDTS